MLCPALLHGIPPAIQLQQHRNFWGDEIPDEFRGDPTPLGFQLSGQTLDPTVNGLLDARTAFERNLNARQFFQCKRTTVLEHDLPTTSFSVMPAPIDPNVYTDGGLKSPTNPLWALGSFGVTWPGRKAEVKPFSSAENDFAFTQDGPIGLDLWGPIPGHRYSSTRTELVGGITALLAPGPVHMGVDSQVFLDRAQEVIQQVTMFKADPFSKWLKRPWAFFSVQAHYCLRT